MRSHLRVKSVVAVAIIGIVQFLSGCKTQIADPAPVDFGQLRVINFAAQNSPIDVYIQGVGLPTDTLPSAQTLGFGLAMVYKNNLTTSTAGTVYHVSIHPVNNRQTELSHVDVTIKPGQK